MRLLLTLSLVAAACFGRAIPMYGQAAPGTEEQQVLAALDAFLQAMKARDTSGMARHMDSLTRFTLVRPRAQGGSRVMALRGSEFVQAVSRPAEAPYDERLRHPRVYISGDIASVWTEYQVRREGRVTHCGFDAFHLARAGGAWKILNMSDTYQTSGCGDSWPEASLAAVSEENEAVRATVQRVFDGMERSDSGMVRSAFATGARFVGLDSTGAFRAGPLDGWIRAIANSQGRWREPLYNVEVRVDDTIAQAWTPYTFYVDGKVRHCGTDSFELLKTAAGWKITQISDTQRRVNCPDPLAHSGAR
jgi:hypothetical protein